MIRRSQEDQVNETVTFPRVVGCLTIDPLARKLHGPAGDSSVEPLVMRLLLHLADQCGEVVMRRDLFATLWGSAQVGDDSLNRLVMRLREALAQSAAEAVMVETVPRTGYRLVAKPGIEATGQIDRRTVVAAGAAAGIALLGAGLWRNSSRRSAAATQLIDQGDALLRDAAPMDAGVAVAPLQRALALEPDNARALGLIALAAETSANNGGSRDAGASLRGAERQAKASLERDPSEPHARLALLDMSGISLDWVEWADQLELLRKDAPANLHVLGSLSSFFQAAGQTSKSWYINEQAAEAAPSSPTPQWRRALRLWTGGENERAMQLSERLLRIWPKHPMVWNARFMILAFTGRLDAARSMLSDATAVLGSHPVRSEQWSPTFGALAAPNQTNVAAARDANLAAARKSPGQAAWAAMALSQLGQLDAAFAVVNAVLLAKGPLAARRSSSGGGFTSNSPSWCRTQWLFMPPLAALRADSRFPPLCEELGLAHYWRTVRHGPDTRLSI